MDKRLILHIGFPKTGTTTIQNFLYERRKILLKDKRILYPSSTPNHSNLLITLFSEHPGKFVANRMNGITEKNELNNLIDEYRTKLEKELSLEKYNTIFFSAEGMINLKPPELLHLKEWASKYVDSWTVVVYVRNPVNYSISVIQELLKMGRTLEKLYDSPPVPRYRWTLKNYSQVFGKERIKIFDFETTVKENFIRNFCNQMGIDDVFDEFPNERHNPSMSMEAALVLSRINHIRPLFFDDGKRNEARTNQELAQVQRIKGRKFDLPKTIQAKVLEKSREEIQWLNSEFNLDLYEDVLLSDEKDYDLNGSEESNDFTQETANSMADIILELVDMTRFSKFRRLIYFLQKKVLKLGK
jgi:hypothetical protein